MNKKWISGLLACVMAFGTVFPLSACKDKPEQEQGGSQGGQNNPGSGSNNNQNGGEIKPGTVITDQSMKSELYNALAQTELGGFTYSASATLTVGEAAQKFLAEGAATVKDGKISGDVCAYTSSEDGNLYMLIFLRDESIFTVSGEENGEDGVSFSRLKAQLKATENPLVLTKSEPGGEAEELLKTPAIVKLVKNLPSLFDGVVTKTEGGFSLEFDMIEAVEGLFDGLMTVAAVIDETAQITLGNLFGQPFLKTTFEKLLNGITATELKEALKKVLPDEIFQSLPEAQQTTTAYAYVEGLLRSGTFYQALTQEDDAWAEYKTFAEVPLEGLMGILTGEEFSFGEMKLVKMLQDLKEHFKTEAVSFLMSLIELDEGELENEELLFTLGFEFDGDKKLLGFSVDALAAGSRTVTENENETESVPGEGETTARFARAPEKKIDVRGTVKIEATIVSSPELLDLTGCKYYTENGGTETIKAKSQT